MPSSRRASWYAWYRSARSACAGWPANPIRRCPCAYRWATACCTPARLSGATAGTSSAGDWWLASTIGIPVACRSARYSGVTAAVTPEYLADLHATGMPIVLASHQSPAPDVPAVAPDNRAGVQQAVAHLYAHGHRRIGFAGHPAQADLAERYEAYQDALRELGLEPDPDLFYDTGSSTSDGGELAGRLMVQAGLPSTAVVAGNDLNAIGVMSTLREAGYRIPEDQAVIGFDDAPEGEQTHQEADRLDTDHLDVLVHARQRRVLLLALRGVVEADHGLVLRDAVAGFPEGGHHPDGVEVVARHHGCRRQTRLHHQASGQLAAVQGAGPGVVEQVGVGLQAQLPESVLVRLVPLRQVGLRRVAGEPDPAVPVRVQVGDGVRLPVHRRPDPRRRARRRAPRRAGACGADRVGAGGRRHRRHRRGDPRVPRGPARDGDADRAGQPPVPRTRRPGRRTGQPRGRAAGRRPPVRARAPPCLLYTSDAADE